METVVNILTKFPNKSVWEVILEQNRYDKNILKNISDGKVEKKDFKKLVSERNQGQWQFGMKSYNIRLGSCLCKHACVYCYVAPMFARWKKECIQPDMESLMLVDPKKVNKKWRKVKNEDRKMYFFPSSSDIFVENAKDYVKSCIELMKAGHEIMFVSKSSMGSMKAIIEEFESKKYDYKKKFVAFITINSDDNSTFRDFEPNTPLFEERVEVVKYLASIGVNVNIMMEPYLVDPIRLIDKIINFIPKDGIIAVGKMNYMPVMKFVEDENKDKIMKAYLENLYKKSEIVRLWEYVKDKENIFLKKDSIKMVLKYI